MSKIQIANIESEANLLEAINTRFNLVEQHLNDKILYRNNPIGEPNALSSDLDMGGQDLLNTGSISGEKITIGTMPLIEVLQNAVYQTIVNPDNPFEVHDGIERFATTVTNLDTLEGSGWFYTTNPPVGSGSGWVLVFALGSGLNPISTTFQVYLNHSSPVGMFTRWRTLGGAWSTWTEYGSRLELNGHKIDPLAHPEILVPIQSQIDSQATLITGVTDVNNLQNTRLDALEDDRLLSIVNTNSIALSTTPITLSGSTVIVSDGITLNGDGSITYPATGRYVVSWTAKVNVSGSCSIYNWLEKWNGSTWDSIPYSGFARTFGSSNEVEISPSYLRTITVPNETYRIRLSASNSSASLTSVVIPNGAIMPSFRLDIRK